MDAFSYLRAWQNPGNFDDQAFLRVRYLDVFESELSSLRTMIGDDNDWILRTTEGLLPPLTRFIDVEIEASFRHGADNDGMADEASLVIDLTTPATPNLTKLPMLQDFRQDAMTLLFETDGNLTRPAVEWGPAGGALTNEVTRVETTQVDDLLSEINERVGMSQSGLSQQLATLRRQGLVQTRRQSQTIYYSLAPSHALEVIDLLRRLYCSGGKTR